MRIHPDDNVLVLAGSLPAGSELECQGQTVRLETALGLGHKLAARPIARGEKVLKYGLPIGRAIQDILQGDHVHLHNMASDYLQSYTLEEGQRYDEETR